MEKVIDDIPEKESTYGRAIVGYKEIKNRKESILDKLIKEKKRLVKDFTIALIATSISLIALINAIYLSKGILLTTGVLLFSLFVSYVSYMKLSKATIKDDIEKAEKEVNEVNNIIENIEKTPS